MLTEQLKLPDGTSVTLDVWSNTRKDRQSLIKVVGVGRRLQTVSCPVCRCQEPLCHKNFLMIRSSTLEALPYDLRDIYPCRWRAFLLLPIHAPIHPCCSYFGLSCPPSYASLPLPRAAPGRVLPGLPWPGL